jgi:hypothetical protein
VLKSLSDHPLKRSFLLFGGGEILTLLFMAWGKHRHRSSLEDLEATQRRVQFSQTGSVAPSAAVLESLRSANIKLNRVNADLNDQLYQTANTVGFRDLAGNSTAAYFELAEFVASMSRQFKSEGIALAENIRFGFSQFEQQGPAPEILSRVMAQKVAAKIILDPLREAKPLALVSLKREFIDDTLEKTSVLQQAAGVRDLRQTRIPETLFAGEKLSGFESYAFELVFEGYTDSLRIFLKHLLLAPLPVVVAQLEVQPLDRYGVLNTSPVSSPSANPFDVLSSADETAVEEGPVPIIRDNVSAFHLRLEVYTGREDASGI